MMIPRKELDSSSEIPIISSSSDIISQLNPVIWLAEKTLTIEYATVGRSNLLVKEAEDNAAFYGMIVSLMASNIVHLIFQALIYTGGMIAN
jgi:hypothetical protein